MPEAPLPARTPSRTSYLEVLSYYQSTRQGFVKVLSTRESHRASARTVRQICETWQAHGRPSVQLMPRVQFSTLGLGLTYPELQTAQNKRSEADLLQSLPGCATCRPLQRILIRCISDLPVTCSTRQPDAGPEILCCSDWISTTTQLPVCSFPRD